MIDLGNNPIGSAPTDQETMQIRRALGISVTIVNVPTATYTLSNSDIDTITRMTYTGGEDKNVTIPNYWEGYTPLEGTLLTIRNASPSTNLTILVEGLITFNKPTGSEILPPQTTAQLLYVGDNTYDML